jgi:hypothetical protein
MSENAMGRPRGVALGDETALNMTPMIDVCFQLIVFFMLTLKFKSIDKRFETELPRVGPRPDVVCLPTVQPITVKLFRRDVEQAPERHFTRVRVGETTTVDLPRGPWPRDGAGESARLAEEDARFADVSRAIAAAWAGQQRAATVRGEIKTPPPSGQLVPHGDVLRVLDAFFEAGLVQVDFEGAPPPVGTRDGGGWDFPGR